MLVSFGGYGLDGLDLDALSRSNGYVAWSAAACRSPIGSGRLACRLALPAANGEAACMSVDEPAMYAAGLRYEDLVRAVDVVVTKPGYGIIAECLANDTALLYTSRGHFIEYDVLTREAPRFLRTAFIDHDDLFAGKWTPPSRRRARTASAARAAGGQRRGRRRGTGVDAACATGSSGTTASIQPSCRQSAECRAMALREAD